MKKTTTDYLNEYRERLEKVLKEKGELTDMDLILEMPKIRMIKTDESEFLEVFNAQKKKYRPASTGHGSLSDKDKKKLIALRKRGFTIDDIEHAIEAMYRNGWAEEHERDIPEHLLTEKNFEGYLNKYDKYKILDEQKQKAKELDALPIIQQAAGTYAEQIKEKEERDSVQRFIDDCKLVYEKSLDEGEWLGTVYQAKPLCEMIRKKVEYSDQEESQMDAQAERNANANLNGASTAGMTAARCKHEIIVKDAIKRRVKLD